MFAKYTLNYVFFDEISLLLLPYIPHYSDFKRCHSFTVLHRAVYFLNIQSRASFKIWANYSICAKVVVNHKVRVFLLESFAELS